MTQARSKVTPALVLSARLGGGATRTVQNVGPSLEDILAGAPRVDRADFQAWTMNDTCPQLRVNYD
jgi:hypothetical protein